MWFFDGSGVDIVRCIQRGGGMENPWVLFGYANHLNYWTTMACHVYNSKHCKVLTIACCDMHSKDAQTQTLFWENFNGIVLKNSDFKVNFKGFMVGSAQTY